MAQPLDPATIGTDNLASLARYRPYPDCKDTDVEWLNHIPSHWRVTRLKRVCTFEYGESLAAGDRTYGNVPVYGSNGAVGAHVCANAHGPCLVIGRKGSFGKINYCPSDVFAIDTTFYVDRRNTDENIRWLYYLLSHIRLDSATRDSAIPGLDREDAYARSVVLCGSYEQRAIAGFLDRETAKIDALVAKKERLIELLKEKRGALITHAVTKGLDPTVPMKDSGVEWLGATPAQWDVKRVKWGARVESGHTPDKKVDAFWKDGNIPWVSLNDTGYLKNHDYIGVTEYCTNEVGLKNSSARLLPPRSVVLSRDATIGLCAITEQPMAVSQHFVAWICSEDVIPEYLLHVLTAMHGDLERLAMGATLRTIGMPDVKTLTTPVPPVDEQSIIVNYIHQECSRLDLLVAKVQRAIDHLEELRAALISAAVTGKIDVRNAA